MIRHHVLQICALVLCLVLSVSCNEEETPPPQESTDDCEEYAEQAEVAAQLLGGGDWNWKLTLTTSRGGENRETPESTGDTQTLRFFTDGTGELLRNGQVTASFVYRVREGGTEWPVLVWTQPNLEVRYALRVCDRELLLNEISTSLEIEMRYER